MNTTTAPQILEAAAGHLRDRASTYDKPEGERSMAQTVAAFKAVTGIELTEEQGWLFMVLLKAVRSQQGAYRADSYEDGSAYFALAGEAAAVERAGPATATSVEKPWYPNDFGDWVEWGLRIRPPGLEGDRIIQIVTRTDRALKSARRTAGPAAGFIWDDGEIAAYRVPLTVTR